MTRPGPGVRGTAGCPVAELDAEGRFTVAGMLEGGYELRVFSWDPAEGSGPSLDPLPETISGIRLARGQTLDLGRDRGPRGRWPGASRRKRAGLANTRRGSPIRLRQAAVARARTAADGSVSAGGPATGCALYDHLGRPRRPDTPCRMSRASRPSSTCSSPVPSSPLKPALCPSLEGPRRPPDGLRTASAAGPSRALVRLQRYGVMPATESEDAAVRTGRTAAFRSRRCPPGRIGATVLALDHASLALVVTLSSAPRDWHARSRGGRGAAGLDPRGGRFGPGPRRDRRDRGSRVEIAPASWSWTQHPAVVGIASGHCGRRGQDRPDQRRGGRCPRRPALRRRRAR